MKRSYSVLAAVLAILTWSAVALADPNNPVSEPKAWTSVDKTLADVAEVEPNNSLATAQFVGCGNVFRPASIAAGVTPPDTDYVSFTANAGEILAIGTDADGFAGQVGDTRIRLFNNTGGVLASDDDSGPGLYSLISGVVAPYTGTYYVGIAAFSTQTGGYKAFIVCCPATAPANDVCAGANQIPCGTIDYAGSTLCYNNNYTPLTSGTGGCTGFTALGRDLVYQIIAAAGDQLSVTYTSTADGSIYIITDCANPTTTCVAGADATLSGQPEVLNYGFTSAGVYYLILDSFGSNTSGAWTLVGSLNCPVPTEHASWGKVKTIYR